MGNKIGEYGAPEMLDRNGTLVVKYPTEMTASLHILNPNAPRFIEAPDEQVLMCSRCGDCKPFEDFDKDVRYTRRKGHRTECKVCRAKEGKLQRLARQWHKRSATPGGTRAG